MVNNMAVALERAHCAAQTFLSVSAPDDLGLLELEALVVPRAMNMLVLALRSQIWKKHVATISYPSDWKESLKERFLPEWAKRRWPVQYTVIDIDHLYPKLRIASQEPVLRVFENRVCHESLQD